MRLTFDKFRFWEYMGKHEKWRSAFHEIEDGHMVTEDDDLITDYCEENKVQIARPRSGLGCLYTGITSQQRITK